MVITSTCTTCHLEAICGGFSTVSSSTFNVVAGAAALLKFTQTPATGTTTSLCAGASNNAIVTAYDATGQYIVTAFTSSVTLSVAGSSTAMSSISQNAIAGVATFSTCVVTSVGTFNFYASSPGLTSATSPSFVVTGAALGAITFSPLTASGAFGASIALTASCYDTAGVLLTTCTNSATLTVTGATATITAGAGPYTPSAGVYTMGVTLSKPGTHSLTLSCPTCGAVTPGSATVTVTSTGSLIVDFNTPIQQNHSGQTYQIKLSSAPSASVTVSISSGDTTKLTVLAAVTFTSANYSTWQTVTVSVPTYSTLATTYTGTITHTISSSDVNYNGVATYTGCVLDASGTATIPIYNFNAFTIDIGSSVVVVEGGSGTITVTLGAPVVGPADFVLTGAWSPALAAEITTTPVTPTLTFTTGNWATPQTITVNVAINPAATGTTTYTLTFTPTGGATDLAAAIYRPSTKASQLTVIDKSAAGIGISGNVVIAASGSTGSYTVKLLTKPTADVVLTQTSSVAAVAITTGATLTFTSANYSTTQTVTLTFTIDAVSRYVSFDAVITHTAASTDTLYNNLVATFTAEILDICKPGVYTWPGGSSCSDCLAGFDCTGATPTACVAGSYKTLTTNVACTSCPSGSYCSSATTANVACPTGYTSSSTGAFECVRCPTGSYVSTVGKAVSACTAGYYSSGGVASCTQSFAGTALLSAHRKAELPCGWGMYSVTPVTASCSLCAAGTSCSSKTSSTGSTCSAPQFSPAGSYSCTNCPSHVTCGSTGPTGLCAEGNTRAMASATMASCTAVTGTYYASIAAPGVTIKCPAGYTINSTKNACDPCPAGSYCDGSTTATACAIGYYSTGKAVHCLPCPPGYYQNTTGQSSCILCTAGSKCSSVTVTPVACATTGQYSFAGALACVDCYPGSNCAAGSTSPMSAFCPSGSYCQYDETKAISTTVCPDGFYGTGTAISASMAHGCRDCSPGSTCTGGGAASCGVGKYCPPRAGPASEFPCPYGTINTSGGAISIADCADCPIGYSCTQGALASQGCVTGNFCPVGSRGVNDHACPMGTYTGPAPGGSLRTLSTDCKVCEAGGYCPVQSTIPLLCPQGTYNANTGGGYLQHCLPCLPGKVCPGGGISATPTVTCLAGYYCPKGVFRPIPCPAGTYTLVTDTGLTSVDDCTECEATYACAMGTTTKLACTAGYYCPAGTGYPTQYPCPSGTSSAANSAALTDCAACVAGISCPTATAAATLASCPGGYYCPASTDYSLQYPCPAGTYTLTPPASALADCSACPQGQYCPEGCATPIDCPAGSYANTTGSKYLGPGITDSCKVCTAGSYCAAVKTTTPAACASGTYSTVGLIACITCVAGYQCNVGTGTSDTAMYANPCDGGYICPAGTGTQSVKCAAGYYCPKGTQAEIDCPPGTYRDTVGAAVLGDCITTPVGYYTNLAHSTAYVTNVCTAGYYCPAGSTYSTVIACPAGTYRATTGAGVPADCAQCPINKYCRFEATVAPVDCPAGYYCPAGSVTPTACPKGTYNSSTAKGALTDCTACDAGKYCDESGAIAVKGDCKAGFICYSKAITSTPTDGPVASGGTGELCPKGGYCPAGCAAQQPCPAGQFNDFIGSKTSADCKPCIQGYYCSGTLQDHPTGQCDAGYYCVAGSNTSQQNLARAGYYAPIGSIMDVPCLPGTFTGTTAKSSCDPCTAGYYCPTSAVSVPTNCPVGYYCPVGSIVPIPCDPGTFNPNTNKVISTDCGPCTGGSYCKTPGLSAPTGSCSAGYYCTSGAMYLQHVTDVPGSYGPCPAGKYCVAGTSTPVDCLAGTYNPSQGGTASTDCLPCPAGYFCSSAGMSSVGVNELCTAGYFCVQGQSSDTTNQCPVGYYCPLGSPTKLMCEAGTYQNAVQQTSCTACPAGSFCPPGTSDPTANPCPAGFYCPAGTKYDTEFACPLGTFNGSTGKTLLSDCQTCSLGSYCKSLGLSAPTGQCDVGFYCTTGSITARPNIGASYGGRCTIGYICPLGSSSKTPCPAGKYCAGDELGAPSGTCYGGYECLSGAIIPAPTDGVTGSICPVGYYCVAGAAKVKCLAGTFLPYTGGATAAECLPCVPGYVCPTDGMTTPTTKCPAGYICASGVSVATVQCPAGSMCPLGSAYSTKCPIGSYQNALGQSSCITCSIAGKYCPEGAIAEIVCEAGYYCALDASGTITSRQPCPVGTFNVITGSTSIAACLPCSPGKYCDTIALAAEKGDCTGGYYCIQGAISPTPLDAAQGGICQKGYYCPVGSSSPTDCTPGSYCQKSGLSAVSGPCLAGYYCILRAWKPNPTDGTTGNICTPGRYCTAGSATPIACPLGKYSPAKGLAAVGDCLPCPYGYYCLGAGLTAPTGKCTAGSYCGPGSSSAAGTFCPIGSYCPEGSYEPLDCPMGTYQDQPGQATCNSCHASKYCTGSTALELDCPQGYYCPVATRFDKEFPCQDGTFAASLGSSTCSICTAGYICNNAATAATTQCPINKYCEAGSAYGLFCLPGTYNSATLGLTSASACTACPTGSYCVDGTVSAPCEAGYYCAGSSPTPTPPSSSSSTNAPCSPGYYCNKGATSPTLCPPGKVNPLPGGSQVSACTTCPPGFYCVANNPQPIPCPAGSYCPQGVQAPIACRIHTYNPSIQSVSESSCIVCPAGYICTDVGAVTYDLPKYKCPAGYYCVEGGDKKIPCPPGTFTNSTAVGSYDACTPCSGGKQCPGGGLTFEYGCPEGTYCQIGSAMPKPCLVGFYCPTNSTAPIICPAGYFCPKYALPNIFNYTMANLTQDVCQASINPLAYHTNDTSPFRCPEYSICPIGSFEPQYCSPGQYVKDNACVNCFNGTYSRVAGGTCQTCSGGFICYAGAKRPDPTSIEIYGGYRCPVGYYCPAGALRPVACPVATYNPKIGTADNSSCLLCPANSYNDKLGQDRCTPCGSSSVSQPGKIICDCIGANRAFQKTDGTCRCIPGYEFTQEGFTLSVEDSTSDCFPKVFIRCAPGEIRGPNGDCKSQSDCTNECGLSGGTVMAGVGICQCNNVRNLDDICNKGCRDRAPVVSIDSQGRYVVRNTTTNRTLAVNMLTMEGYYGAVIPGSDGRVYSIDMQATGPKARYSLGTAFSSYNFTNITIGRRLQTEDPEGIVNPVACLHKGDTFIFSIPDSLHFPVYNKDSLLNTNPDFDYGPFLELKRMITSASTQVTIFAFTFNMSGIYDFSDNSNSDSHIIVSVIGNGQTCPDSDVPLKTRTQAAILTLGTATDSNIIEDPDWGLIGGTMGGLVGIISLLIGGLYIFFTKEWKHTEASVTMYRTKHQAADLTALRLKHHERFSEGDEKYEEEEDDVKGVQAYDDIDPSIFQSMHDRMLEYHKRLTEGFEAQTQEARNSLAKVLDQLEKLKNLLESRLGGLNPLLIKDEEDESPDKPGEQGNRADEAASPTAFYEAMVDKYLGGIEGEREEKTDELRDRVLSDPNLSEQDKEALMRDLEAEMQRIQQQADLDKTRNNDLLQQRLLERRRKRAHAPSHEFQSSGSSGLNSARSDAPLKSGDEQQLELQKIEEERAAALESGSAELRAAHQQKLNKVMSQDEADALMREYERDMKLLEDRTAEDAALKRKQLEQRLLGKRKGKVMPLHIPGLETIGSMEVMPTAAELKADPTKMEELEKQHEEEKQRLIAKQEQEIQLLNMELDNSDPDSIRARLARGVDNEAERKRLMAQLQEAEDAIKRSEDGQQRRLEDRLRIRQQRKSEKKLNLKQQHEEQLTSLLEHQLDEEDRLKSDLELEKLMALIQSKEGSPEQLAALVRKLLDEKHDQELANLAARKQAAVVEKQMQTLQKHLGMKAERLADIRVEARRSGASPQEEKESIMRAESDYLTNLRRDMDSGLGRLEDEYRRKLMELTDRQMRELEDVLRCIRALDPNALQKHLASAQQELSSLKSDAEKQYATRKEALEADMQALERDLKEEEDRTKELDREVEERKKRLEDVALQRQKLEERQRDLREKLKQQGISEEEEENILRKHQQELEQWDKAVEEEMARQRAVLEKKRAARQEKQQSKKVAAYREERQQQLHEEQPRLTIVRKSGVPERLIEPFQDLESRLRVDPLPRMAHYTVEMEGPENLMDSLLKKVKQVEQMVETVDAQQFSHAIEALQNLHRLIASTKSVLRK